MTPEAKPAFDQAPIIIEELDRLGYPLPVPVAKAGPKGIAKRALAWLAEQGKKSYTPEEFRAAVVRVLHDLVLELPKLTAEEERGWALHAAAEIKLAEAGKLDYSASEYMAAHAEGGHEGGQP